MSLTDTSLVLWNTKLPVAALIAQHAAKMVSLRIDEPHREVFDSAVTALIDWWPERRKRNLVDTWNAVHAEPIRLAGELKGNARKAAEICVRALYLQASNLERAGRGRRELPPDCYSTEPEHFEALLRDAIKLHAATQVRDIDRRLKVFEKMVVVNMLEVKQWPLIVGVAGRQGWTRLQPGLRKLPARLRDLGEALDAGGEGELIEVGGRPAVRVTLPGGSRRMGVLTDDERAELVAVVPWLP